VTGDFCPYQGLEPYTREDLAYFFGRERDTEIIASNLFAARLTVLYGASGCGKTSVLLAGVIPLLEDEHGADRGGLKGAPGVVIVEHREWQSPDATTRLAQKIIEKTEKQAGRSVDVGPDAPLDVLLDACSRALRGGRILLILDQFEELFLYHPSTGQDDPFDTGFAQAVNRTDLNAHILLSMRDDQLSRLDRFKGRIPNLLSNMLRLDHLSLADAERAIREPLREYNERRPDGGPETTIEDPVVQDLLSMQVTFESVGQGGILMVQGPGDTGPRIQTPFLQIVLTRLWNEETRRWRKKRKAGPRVLRTTTFRNLGGATGIVHKHLDNALGRLSWRDRSTAAKMLHYLVTPSGSKIALTVEDLASYTRRRPKRVARVTRALAGHATRILRSVALPSGRGQSMAYEIFHDALGPAVLDWRRRFRTRRWALFASLPVGVYSAVGAFVLWEERQWDAEVVRTDVASIIAQSELSLLSSHVGLLAPGVPHRYEFVADSGGVYFFQGICDNRCLNSLELRLLQGSDTLTTGRTGERFEYTATSSAALALEVTMEECDRALRRCHFGYTIHSGSAEDVAALTARDETDINARLDSLASHLPLVAGSTVSDQGSGSLTGGGSVAAALDVRAQETYSVIANCAGGCDLDLDLLDADFLSVTSDYSSSPYAQIAFTPNEDATLRLSVQMYRCDAASCPYQYRVYASPRPGSSLAEAR
jgi:hypothetical protein